MRYSAAKKCIAFILCALLLFVSARQDETGSIHFSPVSSEYLHNASAVTLNNGKKAYILKDISYSPVKNPALTDLILSFNTAARNLRKDDTRKYHIAQADYTFKKNSGALGKGCALFSHGSHRVVVQPSQELWLGSCDDLGSFTFDVRVKLLSEKDCVIFSRIGYNSGKKRGFELRVENERFLVKFHEMFKKDEIRFLSTWLRSDSGLLKDHWYHILISFDRISGKLLMRINNRESQVRYMTDSGNPYDGVYSPVFSSTPADCRDMPPVIIGSGMTGYLDELRISHIPYSQLKKTADIAYHAYKKTVTGSRFPYNTEGVITSPVYSFKGTGTKVTRFNWHENLPKNTFVWMEFRIEDRLFQPFDTKYRWYRIKNNQHNIYLYKKPDGLYARGKYYQWRAHLIASPDGTHTPALYDISLTYENDYAPGAPLFVEARAGSEVIYITWKKNVDADIKGYKIYYGIDSKKYRGVIVSAGAKAIDNSYSHGNYITVAITNDIIEENKKNDPRNILDYPLLRNTVLYFFSVTAYDSYRPGTPYNHESVFSKEVTARPFGGTDIR